MAFLLPHYLHPLYQCAQKWQHYLVFHVKPHGKVPRSLHAAKSVQGAQAEMVTESMTVGAKLQTCASDSWSRAPYVVSMVISLGCAFYLFVGLVWIQYFCA